MSHGVLEHAARQLRGGVEDGEEGGHAVHGDGVVQAAVGGPEQGPAGEGQQEQGRQAAEEAQKPEEGDAEGAAVGAEEPEGAEQAVPGEGGKGVDDKDRGAQLEVVAGVAGADRRERARGAEPGRCGHVLCDGGGPGDMDMQQCSAVALDVTCVDRTTPYLRCRPLFCMHLIFMRGGRGYGGFPTNVQLLVGPPLEGPPHTSGVRCILDGRGRGSSWWTTRRSSTGSPAPSKDPPNSTTIPN